MGQQHDEAPQAHEFAAALSAPGNAAATIEVAQQAVEPVELDTDKMYLIRGADGGLQVLDLEDKRDHPDRMRGTYKPATVDDFIAYVREWATDASTVWVHPLEGKVVGIIDDGDSGTDTFGWRQHRAELGLIVTEEWKFWKEHSGQMLSQWDFAEKIEDGLSDVVEPSAATMLEIAQTLHVKNNVTFRSGVELSNQAVKFQYDEDVEGTAGKRGELQIPETFELALAPYVGEDTFRLTARFRYKPQGGKLQMGYKLQEPERAERTILEEIAGRIRSELGTRAKVFLGEPPQK
jgi:uncharacterized protein YfdQ (DUF2303 family)